MVYDKDRADNVLVIGLLLSGIKTGDIEVTEKGAHNKDDKCFIDALKFRPYDEELGKIVDFYIICCSKEGEDEDPDVFLPNDLVGPENLSVVKELYTEIHKKQKENKIKDKWHKYFMDKLKKKSTGE